MSKPSLLPCGCEDGTCEQCKRILELNDAIKKTSTVYRDFSRDSFCFCGGLDQSVYSFDEDKEMKLEELKNLALAADDMDKSPILRTASMTALRLAANPQTILSLIDAVEKMRLALNHRSIDSNTNSLNEKTLAEVREILGDEK